MQVKIISLNTIDVKNEKSPPMEDLVNDFIKTVIPVSFSYSVVPGFQSVLIAYEQKP